MVKWILPLVGIFAIYSTQAQAEKTLAEKLGFSKDDRVLLIHADDFGMNEGTNRATKEVLEFGLVKSASVMIPCPNAVEAITQTPGADLGIHLTFNSEWKHHRWGPIAYRKKIGSLLEWFNKHGHFWADEIQTFILGRGKHLEIEGRAQIKRAVLYGMEPTHIDSHMGTVLMKYDWAKIYLKLAKEFKLAPMFPDDSEHLRKQLPSLIHKDIARAVKYAKDSGFHLLDYLILEIKDRDEADRRAKTIEMLKNLKAGVTQYIIHPAYLEKPFSGTQIRRRGLDAKFFQEEEFANLIKELDIKLIGYRELLNIYDWSKVNPK